MNTHLEKQFSRIGARLKIADRSSGWQRGRGGIALDVLADREGEFFELVPAASTEVQVAVLDVRPRDRHLLLMVREGTAKSKLLCGHDERHWFVAGIPDAAAVGTVQQAMEALKPAAVQIAQMRARVRGKARQRRKNAAFLRQGEWFFVPAPNLVVDPRLVLRNEPLVRSTGGKPHRAEFCYRTGGVKVYVCGRHPSGVSESQYQRILSRNPKAKTWGWQVMRRDPEVYVTGRIRHTDHATINLRGWHRVWMNTENKSAAMRHVAFLD